MSRAIRTAIRYTVIVEASGGYIYIIPPGNPILVTDGVESEHDTLAEARAAAQVLLQRVESEVS